MTDDRKPGESITVGRITVGRNMFGNLGIEDQLGQSILFDDGDAHALAAAIRARGGEG